ncbi:SPX domain-containing protein [Trichoderma gamsii]|uniref:SPX domain-containing protein n=2 Tax=Trichoderma gamsii TaxID=398673 RepID=A0A2P4ZTA7_9HYPO|nr:SPX domain-containing protein [Trichoderma gamsii]PON27524.1 SPX domain-containing protein [Trichoderma gamsii]
MKYGVQLERESVPEWSLHNLDYNSLKHEIKVHTTRDQATALTIPGHQDTALRRFEDALFTELCNQHDRLDLFVTSKADEVSRRLEHTAANIRRFAAKSHHLQADSPSVSLRYQRKFIKYERELLRCREDTQALSRFVNAQVVAFRKILKKYRKWTGSSSLSSRFNEEILSHPKSFTRRSFTDLQERHDEIERQLRHATPAFSEPSSPSSVDTPVAPSNQPSSSHRVAFDPLPPSCFDDTQPKYWNEYDDGSDAGGADEEYAIYINPDQESTFPGLSYAQAIVSFPFEKAKEWFGKPQTAERQPLFSPFSSGDSINQGYGSTTAVHTDSEEEEAYASSDGFPTRGYATHYALPSVNNQQLRRYRERVLFWGTMGCFGATFIFLGIAGILISTGRHKLRVEVDAGATVGAVVSLFCACSGLGMTLYREDELSLSYRLAVWGIFIASCLLNGMLLILILGNAP